MCGPVPALETASSESRAANFVPCSRTGIELPVCGNPTFNTDTETRRPVLEGSQYAHYCSPTSGIEGYVNISRNQDPTLLQCFDDVLVRASPFACSVQPRTDIIVWYPRHRLIEPDFALVVGTPGFEDFRCQPKDPPLACAMPRQTLAWRLRVIRRGQSKRCSTRALISLLPRQTTTMDTLWWWFR